LKYEIYDQQGKYIMHMKEKTVLILLGITLLIGNVFSDDFFAYYTRLPYEDKISDQHADIIVSYGEAGRVVFSRESSYLPRWDSKGESWYFTEVIARTGDGTDLQPDRYNRHSYVRLIKNTSTEVIVHWRYYPDILKTKMTDVVHELFIFTPEGSVKRNIKKGSTNIDDWKSDAGMIVQQISLMKNGIKTSSKKQRLFIGDMGFIPSEFEILENDIAEAAASWSFDEAKGDRVKDAVTNIQFPITGHKSYWTRGVSGSALQFDGYYSGINIPVQYTPRISDEFTIEAWISLAAHPFGWVPVVTQSNWKRAGYYLGINAYGEIGFMFNNNGEWMEVKTDERIAINQWHHIAVTLNGEDRKISLYLDGAVAETKMIESEDEIALIHANAPLSIGLNTDHLSPLPRERYSYGQYASMTGFEGAIDEIKYYYKTLTPDEVMTSYKNLVPDEDILFDPGFAKRILPGHPGFSDTFGAQYTHLKYNPLWDDAWRTSDYPDVLVKFDELPTSVTFWRGPSYGAGWVTEKNFWMVDQSVETGNARSYVEHMSDKEGRYSHVRIIENNPARVVVHWRYNSNDVLYSTHEAYGPSGIWIDEYMTIYPDGVGIRKVKQKAESWSEDPPTKISWQDVQFLAQPGMTPDDVMNLEAVHLATVTGDTAVMDWTDGVPDKNPLPAANLELINFKSDYKVFLAFQEGTFINPWGRVRDDMYCHFMTWNHWPVAFINSQGKSSLFPTRITHSALCAADNAVEHGNMAMYGFTNGPVSKLVPLVCSWNFPPEILNISGGNSLDYNQEQRAYHIESDGNELSFEINASQSKPLINPCFVIKNIESRNVKARFFIDNLEIQSGKNFRQGVEYDTAGQPVLIIWLKLNTNSSKSFKIKL
jgi:hypothetical protein